MRGAPNFTAWPNPVDGQWKWALLRWLSQETGIRVLVETGTCEGSTCHALRNDFDLIYTIEMDEKRYQRCCDFLGQFKNIKVYQGTSRTKLDEILRFDVHPGPVLFWLDAHVSGEGSANDGDPLPDELLAITRLRPDALVVIDDMRSVNEFRGQVSQVDLTSWHVEYRTGEIVLHQEGRYSIPPFES